MPAHAEAAKSIKSVAESNGALTVNFESFQEVYPYEYNRLFIFYC